MTEPVYIESSATFDFDRIYRYGLLRRWAPGPSVLFVMLNPSTADETKLDPTLRRCLGFTRSWVTGDPWVRGAEFDVLARSRREIGDATPDTFGAFEICNIYALRSPHPRDLWKVSDPVGPINDEVIAAAAKRASLVIVGWGDNAKPERERMVAQLLSDLGVQPYALKLCKSGSPNHPLYLPETSTPQKWYAKGLR